MSQPIHDDSQYINIKISINKMMWGYLADSFCYKLLVGWLFNDEHL